jgi:5'-deoxynucleotidase YfbR-like HD superfamily hydrolase
MKLVTPTVTRTQAQLRLILCGGRVRRFHAKPMLKDETVAEHQHLVAWVATLVMDTPRAELLLACLSHDLPECDLGDLPSPAKRLMELGAVYRREEVNIYRLAGMPDYYAKLTDDEKIVLKFADNVAGYLRCVYEKELGNTYLGATTETYLAYIRESVAQTEFSERLKDFLQDLEELLQRGPVR